MLGLLFLLVVAYLLSVLASYSFIGWLLFVGKLLKEEFYESDIEDFVRLSFFPGLNLLFSVMAAIGMTCHLIGKNFPFMRESTAEFLKTRTDKFISAISEPLKWIIR